MNRLRIPGNLLLLGEYAVLEEGGLGITMAIAPYVTAEVVEAEGFSLTGVTPVQTVRWRTDAGNSEADSFLAASVPALGRILEQQAGLSLPQLGVDIRIDSSEFFDAAGRKYGYGSSAAVVVALVVAVLARARDLAPAATDAVDALAAAVAVHRAAQGGRGSGYDVAASLYGGVGLFRGGREPSFEPHARETWPRTLLSAGPAAVGTGSAITRYQALGRENPGFIQTFVNASNDAARRFIKAESWPEQRDAVLEARRWSIRLGDAIEVPSRPPFADYPDMVPKCLGAGDELIGWFADAGMPGEGEPPRPAAEVTAAWPQGAGVPEHRHRSEDT